MLIQPGQNDDVPLAAFKGAGRRKKRMMQPGAFHLMLAAAGAVQFNSHGLTMEVGIEQRDIDVLALAGLFAVKQRAGDGAHRMNPGADIADGDHWHVRRAVFLTDQRGYSGISLPDEIETGVLRERTGLAEGRYRAHYDARV